MTMITRITNDEPSEAMLQVAKEQFETAVVIFAEMTKRVQSGEFVPASDIKKTAQDLRAASILFFGERNRIDELIKKDAGVVHDYALDFDAARDEIRRRLARLRDS